MGAPSNISAMRHYAAFLRGMNLGNRRITNDELCSAFAGLGLESPAAFLASGNVVFGSRESSPKALAELIENGLADALGYSVPTFLRGADEVRAMAAHEPFPAEVVAASGGKLQVALLGREPLADERRAVLARASDEDRLAFGPRELYWLPSGGILDSELDLAGIEAEIGPFTMRTRRTVERLVAKFFVG